MSKLCTLFCTHPNTFCRNLTTEIQCVQGIFLYFYHCAEIIAHISHLALFFSFDTFFVWHFFHLTLFSFGTFFIWHFFHSALFSFGTLFSFDTFFIWHFFHLTLFSFGTFFIWHFFHLALFSFGRNLLLLFSG